MVRALTMVLGGILILIGLAGFASRDLMGMHLSNTHNVIHLVSGALALFIGWKGTHSGVHNFCKGFGIVYGLLGLVGFFFGAGTVTLHHPGLAGMHDAHLWKLIPGHLELGTNDHGMHIALATLFLILGFIPERAERRVEESADRTRDKVTPGP